MSIVPPPPQGVQRKSKLYQFDKRCKSVEKSCVLHGRYFADLELKDELFSSDLLQLKEDGSGVIDFPQVVEIVSSVQDHVLQLECR